MREKLGILNLSGKLLIIFIAIALFTHIPEAESTELHISPEIFKLIAINLILVIFGSEALIVSYGFIMYLTRKNIIVPILPTGFHYKATEDKDENYTVNTSKIAWHMIKFFFLAFLILPGKYTYFVSSLVTNILKHSYQYSIISYDVIILCHGILYSLTMLSAIFFFTCKYSVRFDKGKKEIIVSERKICTTKNYVFSFDEIEKIKMESTKNRKFSLSLILKDGREFFLCYFEKPEEIIPVMEKVKKITDFPVVEIGTEKLSDVTIGINLESFDDSSLKETIKADISQWKILLGFTIYMIIPVLLGLILTLTFTEHFYLYNLFCFSAIMFLIFPRFMAFTLNMFKEEKIPYFQEFMVPFTGVDKNSKTYVVVNQYKFSNANLLMRGFIIIVLLVPAIIPPDPSAVHLAIPVFTLLLMAFMEFNAQNSRYIVKIDEDRKTVDIINENIITRKKYELTCKEITEFTFKSVGRGTAIMMKTDHKGSYYIARFIEKKKLEKVFNELRIVTGI
jgi:hypothetical protein